MANVCLVYLPLEMKEWTAPLSQSEKDAWWRRIELDERQRHADRNVLKIEQICQQEVRFEEVQLHCIASEMRGVFVCLTRVIIVAAMFRESYKVSQACTRT